MTYRIEINGREFGVRSHNFYSALEFAANQAHHAGDLDLEHTIRSRLDVPSITRNVRFDGKIRVRVEKIRPTNKEDRV